MEGEREERTNATRMGDMASEAAVCGGEPLQFVTCVVESTLESE